MASGFSALSMVSAGSALSVDDIIRITCQCSQGSAMTASWIWREGSGLKPAWATRPSQASSRWFGSGTALLWPPSAPRDSMRRGRISSGLRAAKYALQWQPLPWAVERANSLPAPAVADQYDTATVRLLVAICFHLASLHPQRRFFLSSHQAGSALGVSHDKVLRRLQMLCADGILELTERGNHGGPTATGMSIRTCMPGIGALEILGQRTK